MKVRTATQQEVAEYEEYLALLMGTAQRPTYKTLRPSILCRQLSMRFEKHGLVHSDGSQELFDRLQERVVWATIPYAEDKNYGIEGVGDVDVARVSLLQARDSFGLLQGAPSRLHSELFADTQSAIVSQADQLSRALAPMDGFVFEEFVRDLLARRGLRAMLTPARKDNGVDVIAVVYDTDAFDLGQTIVVQCKKSQRTIGVSLVRELAGARLLHGADRAVLVTTGHFSPEAQHLVKDPKYYGIDLVDLTELKVWWTQACGYRK